MKKIVSVQNNTIKHIVKLQKKSYRQEHEQFIAQGISVCTTLLATNYKPVAFYITQKQFEKLESSFNQDFITIVSEAVMQKISTSVTPSGIIGIFKIPQNNFTPNHNSIVLDNIQDPGNMGTLIRSAAAMNIKNVFLIGGVDLYNPKTIQSAAGTIGYSNVVSITWNEFLKKHQSFSKAALIVKGGKTPKETNISESILIIGNEGQGLANEVIQACNQKITIPMPGNIESLNAAVAGSIAMYLKCNQSNKSQVKAENTMRK